MQDGYGGVPWMCARLYLIPHQGVRHFTIDHSHPYTNKVRKQGPHNTCHARPGKYYIFDVHTVPQPLSFFVVALLCFINPRVRKIRNEVSSCPGIFSGVLLCFMKARVRKIRNEASICLDDFSRLLEYSFLNFFEFEDVYGRLTSATGARNNEIERHRVRSCQAPQMPSVQGCRSGVGKALKLTYTQTHSAGPPCRGGSDRNLMHGCGEGGSGEKQGEKEWWEVYRRERENGEN